MNKEQAKLVAQVEQLDREWHAADGERKGMILEERQALAGRSDVAEALGAASQARSLLAEESAREAELNARANSAGVDPVDLAAADQALAAALEHWGDGNNPTFRQVVDFLDKHRHSTPGYIFAIASCYAAGKEAAKQ